MDIREGQCFNGGGEEEVAEVQDVPCEEPHDSEVYAVFDYPAQEDDYPGNDVLRDYGDAECRDRFDDFVGIDYEQSELVMGTLWPSTDTWAMGDRAIVCTVSAEEEQLTGSMKGSRR